MIQEQDGTKKRKIQKTDVKKKIRPLKKFYSQLTVVPERAE